MDSDVKLYGNLKVEEKQVDLGDANFSLETSIGAVLANSEKTDILALEIDFRLKGKKEEIPQDSWVWMYTSLRNKGDQAAEDWETVSCLV